MKKELIGLFVLSLVLLLNPLVIANIQIKDEAIKSILIREFDSSLRYNISITNENEFSDIFVIDTLLDIEISPKSFGGISAGGTKTLEIEVTPSEEIKEKYLGKNFAFEYFVKGEQAEIKKDSLVFKIVSVLDILDVTLPASISAEDKVIIASIGLKEDIVLSADLKITSKILFKETELILMKEKQDILIDLSNVSEEKAGVYVTTFSFDIKGETFTVKKDLLLGAVVDIETREETKGNIFSKEVTITKTNRGNSATKVTIALSRSVIASLFTTFTDSPKIKKEKGFYLYEWENEINPGESFEVTLKTSYYLPFIILFLILIAAIIFKIVTTSPVKIIKKATKVRTKSGVFASKIIIYAKNTGKAITNVKIIDRLPAFTEVLPDKFGVISPSEIKKRSVIWDFAKLSKGEEVMFSYIIYSKINVFGKLEIPAAVVTYRDDKDTFKETESNKLYILSEEEGTKEEI